MEITLNNKKIAAENGTTIKDILGYAGIEPIGIAIAVNNRVIPRDDWDKTGLNDGDKVVVIKAACGG